MSPRCRRRPRLGQLGLDLRVIVMVVAVGVLLDPERHQSVIGVPRRLIPGAVRADPHDVEAVGPVLGDRQQGFFARLRLRRAQLSGCDRARRSCAGIFEKLPSAHYRSPVLFSRALGAQQAACQPERCGHWPAIPRVNALSTSAGVTCGRPHPRQAAPLQASGTRLASQEANRYTPYREKGASKSAEFRLCNDAPGLRERQGAADRNCARGAVPHRRVRQRWRLDIAG